jgi:hypothetical protein
MEQNDATNNIRGTDIASKTERLLKRLIHVMGQENLALESYNTQVAEEMAQEKTLLIGNYRALIKELKQDPEAFNRLDDDAREKLKQLTVDFENAMRENARAVYGRRQAVKKLLDRILAKARDIAGSSVKSYNAKGKMNVQTSSKTSSLSTHLNETY